MGVASTFHFLNRYRCQINWRGQNPIAKKQKKTKNISTEARCVVGLKKSIRRKAGEKSNKEKSIFLHCKFATFIMWMYLYELELIMNSNSFQTVMRQCCRCHWWVYMCLNSSQFPHCVQRSSHSTAAFMLHTIVSRMPLSPSLICTLWRLLTPTYCLNLISLINKLN